jgi:hypothetical protein
VIRWKKDVDNNFAIHKNSENEWWFAGSSANAALSSGAILANEWTNVAIVISSGATPTIKAFVNGVEEASVTGDGDFNATSELVIGASDNKSEEFWAGQLDDVRVYNRALSAIEVRSIYHYPWSSLRAA